MQTSLPNLPFTNHGNLDLEPIHSIASSTRRTYPRTDLQTLRAWESFPGDIHLAIQSATDSAHVSSTPFHIKAITHPEPVADEEEIRAYASFALHKPVREMLQKFGVNGRFRSPGGNASIVGSPDFSWILSLERQPHPKLIVEYKTWWAADLQHGVVAADGDYRIRNALSPDSLHALEQIYGYMTFNNNRFGILTNWKRALFLRRAEVAGRYTLDFYTVELDGNQDISMLKAWVGMVLLAEADWFYASTTLCSAPPNQTFGTSNTARESQRTAIEGYCMQSVNGDYECRTLDFRLCHFDLSTAHHGENSCVVETRLVLPPILGALKFHTRQVICKVVDATRYPDAVELLNAEVRAYAASINLQGKVIPRLYGFYMVWGILRFIALEPVGQAIAENEPITRQLCDKMKEALRRIHNAGYVHGDIARRNFCRTESGRIFLVDLESCRRTTNQAEFLTEMNIVDEWHFATLSSVSRCD